MIKQKAIDYLGGSCKRCGYDKYIGALEFHHRDPAEKDFTISSSLSWEVIQSELDKCDVLCANCHREVHNENRNNCRVVQSIERTSDKGEVAGLSPALTTTHRNKRYARHDPPTKTQR